MGLAAELRERTAAVHAETEQKAVAQAFVQGNFQPIVYLRYLQSIRPIYQALESALNRHCNQRLIAPIFLPDLFRLPSIQADMDHLEDLLLEDPANPIPYRSAAGHEYAGRIQALSDVHPELLISHAYVRYLGDLSGGQILRQSIGRVLQSDRDGLAYFIFNGIEDPRDFKEQYRQELNALPLARLLQQEIIREAQLSFSYSGRIFQELEAVLNFRSNRTDKNHAD
ncbi:MAG: biliverdin-producing heme oxygenase [Leptospiraceae bacterium]|nr:biliverdin-producing heme oxygenase [Leptospiraceae bacterium]